MADEQGLCGLVGDDAFLALCRIASASISYGPDVSPGSGVDMVWARRHTFFAFSESSDASMVMYLTPLILMPLTMTCLGSLLSEKEAAMALRSLSETWVYYQCSVQV